MSKGDGLRTLSSDQPLLAKSLHGVTIRIMTPPEVVLDRCVRTLLRHKDYVGKLVVEQVESASFRSFLSLIQETMNEALRLEGINASGGVEHPPFHFDYLEVTRGIRNAHAFQYGGFSFIAVTLPLVELLWNISERLSRSSVVLQLLRLDSEESDVDALHGLLFRLQLVFLVSHEYTHHVHRHCVETGEYGIGVWTEFLQDAMGGNLNCQAQEIDADGYAAYLVLAHLLGGEGRQIALSQMNRVEITGDDADALLLTSFFLAVMAFFCALWDERIDMASVYQSRHPPPPVRIKYVIQIVEMWCGQNATTPLTSAQLQSVFHAAAETIGRTAKQAWDIHMAFLRSADGAQYDQQLFAEFEGQRQSGPSNAA